MYCQTLEVFFCAQHCDADHQCRTKHFKQGSGNGLYRCHKRPSVSRGRRQHAADRTEGLDLLQLPNQATFRLRGLDRELWSPEARAWCAPEQ